MYWNFRESELTEFLQANCKLLQVSGYMDRNIFKQVCEHFSFESKKCLY